VVKIKLKGELNVNKEQVNSEPVDNKKMIKLKKIKHLRVNLLLFLVLQQVKIKIIFNLLVQQRLLLNVQK
jgi:hypothetical protein